MSGEKSQEDGPATPPFQSAFAARLQRYKCPSSSPSPPLQPKLPSPPETPSRKRGAPSARNSKGKQKEESPVSKHWKSEDGAEQEEQQQDDKPSPSPKKKAKKPSRSFAHPSVYAEVGGLTDSLRDGLDLVICGINPGLESGRSGYHYAHPTNHFYRCVHRSGFSDKLLTPEEGQTLPDRTSPSIGLTNLVDRATAEAAELSMQEQQDSVPVFLRKIMTYKPRAVAFAGMGVCDVFLKYLWNLPPPSASPPTIASTSAATSTSQQSKSPTKTKRKPARPKSTVGLQPFTLSCPSPTRQGERELVYVWSLPSPSGLVVKYQLTEKIQEFAKLRQAILSVQGDPSKRLDFPGDTTVVDFALEDLPQRMEAAADALRHKQEAGASPRKASSSRGRVKKEVVSEDEANEDVEKMEERPRLVTSRRQVRMIKMEDLNAQPRLGSSEVAESAELKQRRERAVVHTSVQ